LQSNRYNYKYTEPTSCHAAQHWYNRTHLTAVTLVADLALV